MTPRKQPEPAPTPQQPTEAAPSEAVSTPPSPAAPGPAAPAHGTAAVRWQLIAAAVRRHFTAASHHWATLVKRSTFLRRRSLGVAAGIVALVIVLNTLVFFFSISAVRDRDAWVSHTNVVLAQLGDVRADTTTASASARGYVISGDPSFLPTFAQARTSVSGELARLQSLTADNPTQQHRIAQLRPLIATELNDLQQAITSRQAGQDAQAMQLATQPGSGPARAPVRSLIAQMQTTEQGLLVSRDAQAAAAERGATVAFVLTALFDLALLAFVLMLIRETMSLRERVAAEDARAEARAQVLALEAANQRMNEFVSIAGHELRTPLTSAALNVQMAERRLAKLATGLGLAALPTGEVERLRVLFASAERQLKRQERLVADLLDLSRVEAGRLEMRMEPSDLAAIVAEAVREALLLHPDRTITLDLSPSLSPTRRDARRKGKELAPPPFVVEGSQNPLPSRWGRARTSSLRGRQEPKPPPLTGEGAGGRARTSSLRGRQEPNPPPLTGEGAGGEVSITVLCDAERVRQVLMNYLTNALKYSEPARPVAVRLERLPRAARVSVTDHGPGLTPAQQAHLWERFYRAEGIEVQSGSGVGLGLGLYISQQIVERHGGQVGVDSVPGQGSTFWFTLPLAEPGHNGA